MSPDRAAPVDRLALGIARDCNIVHNRPPYWSTLEDRRGMFGQLALLVAVSWLHVSGRLTGVHAGAYRVVWRLAVFPHATNVFDIDFRAETSAGSVSESRLPFNASLQLFGSDLFDFALPQPLVIAAPFEDVLLECKETATNWKTNIALCSVRLEPISALPFTKRYRENSRRMVLGPSGAEAAHTRAAPAHPPPPGAGYRLWKPWTLADRCGSVCMALFGVAIAVGFAYLLVDRAT
ncbi:hypothetical protein IWQ56_004098 [Coemansia nantahalensis]|nr:hypothetical protein IWQ56_004098 [Coemansia nantahalensis]